MWVIEAWAQKAEHMRKSEDGGDYVGQAWESKLNEELWAAKLRLVDIDGNGKDVNVLVWTCGYKRFGLCEKCRLIRSPLRDHSESRGWLARRWLSKDMRRWGFTNEIILDTGKRWGDGKSTLQLVGFNWRLTDDPIGCCHSNSNQSEGCVVWLLLSYGSPDLNKVDIADRKCCLTGLPYSQCE